ncbi:hypothetical protein ACLOJK_020113 [Asimina triloba]
MESGRAVACFLLVATLVFSPRMMGVDAKDPRWCHIKSKLFKGLCFSEANCREVCKYEGYVSGGCQALPITAPVSCFCKNPC